MKSDVSLDFDKTADVEINADKILTESGLFRYNLIKNNETLFICLKNIYFTVYKNNSKSFYYFIFKQY